MNRIKQHQDQDDGDTDSLTISEASIAIKVAMLLATILNKLDMMGDVGASDRPLAIRGRLRHALMKCDNELIEAVARVIKDIPEFQCAIDIPAWVVEMKANPDTMKTEMFAGVPITKRARDLNTAIMGTLKSRYATLTSDEQTQERFVELMKVVLADVLPKFPRSVVRELYEAGLLNGRTSNNFEAFMEEYIKSKPSKSP